MTNNNGTRTEIVSRILEAAIGYEDGDDSEGTTLTKLMYKVFLSHEQLKEYLILLIENGLLHYDTAMCKFKITEKGLRFVEIYNNVNDVMEEGEQQI